MNGKRTLLCFFVLLSVTGCFARRSETIQKESTSFLQFTGNCAGSSFTLQQESMDIYQNISIDEGKRYSVKPGVYRLQVSKFQRVIVDRKLFLVDGQTREIEVP